jgi:hypothetical protein
MADQKDATVPTGKEPLIEVAPEDCKEVIEFGDAMGSKSDELGINTGYTWEPVGDYIMPDGFGMKPEAKTQDTMYHQKQDEQLGGPIGERLIPIEGPHAEQYRQQISVWEMTSHTVHVADGKLHVSRRGKVDAKLDAMLIGKVVWRDENPEIGDWTWGYDLADYKGPVTPRREFKDEQIRELHHKGCEAVNIVDTIYHICEEYGYELAAHQPGCGDRNEEYVFSISGWRSLMSELLTKIMLNP